MFNSSDRQSTNRNPAIRLSGLVKEYDSLAGKVAALRGIDLAIERGEFVVIVGKSGAGKTTLVNMIAGLDRCTSGEIWVDGAAVHQMGTERAAQWRSRHVGVVFQTFELIPGLSLIHNVMLPAEFSGSLSKTRCHEAALALLDQVEIGEHAHKPPSAISGGQQQRVAIARALINEPPVIVADEPTGSLDSGTTQAVLRLLRSLSERGHTVVVVTHDPDLAAGADRIITLADGLVAGDRQRDDGNGRLS